MRFPVTYTLDMKKNCLILNVFSVDNRPLSNQWYSFMNQWRFCLKLHFQAPFYGDIFWLFDDSRVTWCHILTHLVSNKIWYMLYTLQKTAWFYLFKFVQFFNSKAPVLKNHPVHKQSNYLGILSLWFSGFNLCWCSVSVVQVVFTSFSGLEKGSCTRGVRTKDVSKYRLVIRYPAKVLILSLKQW